MTWLRDRLTRAQREEGFTLIELVVATTIGTIVILAAYMVLDRSVSLQAQVDNRSDALQRGRLTLELVTRQLRSQVCLGSATEPITSGQTNTVSFYSDTSDGSVNPIERKLTYDPVAKTMTEDRYLGTGSYPDLTFPGYPNAPTTDRIIGTNLVPVKQAGVDQPIFNYFAWDDADTAQTGDMVQLTTPLSTADVASTIMIRVQYVSQPNRRVIKAEDTVTLTGDAYMRTADPSKPKEGPTCL